MTSGRSDIIDLTGVVMMETDKAWRVDFGELAPVWLPKSQVEFDGDKTFSMPEWLAMEKGLI